jgi:diacylglycerol kinase family enzyme
MKRVLVVLNAKAGTLEASEGRDEAGRLRRRFAAHGVEADVREVEGPKLPDAAREARESGVYDLIVAGGGDGTLNAVGSQLVGSETPFAVLPLGTLNHLAKELEMPTELEAAVDALVAGRTVPFNVGEVNGRAFLLFSAIGLYSDVVWHRDAQRRALGRKKWPAMAVAYWKMIWRWPLMRVRVRVTGRPAFYRLTPAAYVSVSDYQLRLMGLTESSCGGRAALNIYLAAKKNRRGMVWLMIKAVLRMLRRRKDFEMLCAGEVELSTRRQHIRVGVDGEVFQMETPLRFRLVEGGLRMRVPAEKTEGAEAGATATAGALAR